MLKIFLAYKQFQPPQCYRFSLAETRITQQPKMGSLFPDQKASIITWLVVASLIFLKFEVAEARTRIYRWEVSYQYKSPDCYQKLAITINGETPGPTIRAQQGDLIFVELTNGLIMENVLIHWHGIQQLGTVWNDGTDGVTQCPILPGETFTYKFVTNKAGTFVYHAHYSLQRSAGLYGSIQVSLPDGVSEPFSYDEDRSIILNDWWHKSSYEQAMGLSAFHFLWVNEPDSLLIQGRGLFDCSLVTVPNSNNGVVCNATNPECSPHTLTVVSGKTYRLRIASLTSLSALNFEIEGHNLTIVESDGNYIEPIMVKNLNIYSGETYSVLVKADQDPSRNYWAAINVVSRERKTPPGLALFNYYPNHPKKRPPTAPPSGPAWNDTDYRLAQSQALRARQGLVLPPPLSSDRVMIFLNTQNLIDGYVRWSINNISFTQPKTPYLIAIKNNLTNAFDQNPPPETYDYANYDIYSPNPNPNASYSNAIYRLKFNSTVDVILQNANMMKPNNSETHPWHLHGHDFWVLGYGKGRFDPARDPERYNLVDPIVKNTVPLHPYGWTAIRFVTSNPGVWAFHCHVEPHFYLGMGVVFEEGMENIGALPISIMGCGDAKT